MYKMYKKGRNILVNEQWKYTYIMKGEKEKAKMRYFLYLCWIMAQNIQIKTFPIKKNSKKTLQNTEIVQI